MTEVVSIKFKNRGKCYFFAPNSLTISNGDKVVVETSKGLEMADCCRGNHMVADNAVVQPLRPVVRVATADDMRVAELNKQREKEAFDICQKKIEEHKLDMKLVDVECNFEGNKTMFFFTSDGRVDFRELVKDLAGVFRNRIELRQIGVRDEAKMIGGIGICGRPYCCSQFLDDFQPVSTKMAKVQSLSLNPAKISGSCGRLMCCLRYEQEAYEDLLKKVPKQGAFVQTKDGYGTAVQVNLLRQTIKVKLDKDSDDSMRIFKPNELAAVPGGRPKDGEALPSVFTYVPEEEEIEDDPANDWVTTVVVEPERIENLIGQEGTPMKKRGNSSRRRRGHSKGKGDNERAQSDATESKPQQNAPKDNRRRNNDQNAKVAVKQVKVEKKPTPANKETKPAPANKEVKPTQEGDAVKKNTNNSRRRRYFRNKPKGEGPKA